MFKKYQGSSAAKNPSLSISDFLALAIVFKNLEHSLMYYPFEF